MFYFEYKFRHEIIRSFWLVLQYLEFPAVHMTWFLSLEITGIYRIEVLTKSFLDIEENVNFVQDTGLLPLTMAKSFFFQKVCVCVDSHATVAYMKVRGHWVLRIKLRSPGCVATAYILWVMSLAPLVSLNYKIHKPLEFFLALKLTLCIYCQMMYTVYVVVPDKGTWFPFIFM